MSSTVASDPVVLPANGDPIAKYMVDDLLFVDRGIIPIPMYAILGFCAYHGLFFFIVHTNCAAGKRTVRQRASTASGSVVYTVVGARARSTTKGP